MAQQQHSVPGSLEKKHVRVDGSTEGGACLSRHDAAREPGPNGKLKKHSCNYRWQGFKKALDKRSQYNWRKYEELSQAKTGRSSLSMVARTKSGRQKVSPPDGTGKQWDVTANGLNFCTSCNRPYWHESHHIVPNSDFRKAISDVGEGKPLKPEYVKMIRNGLLGESYNLNHKINMIILPMDRKVARALGLPKHRRSAEHRSHRAYSRNVRTRLDDIFGPIQKSVKAHETPDYSACKDDIEVLSDELYGKIVSAGEKMKKGEMKGSALDQIPEKHLAGAKPKTSLGG